MTIDEALFKHLTTDAGLTPVIAARVYPRKLPQKPVLPAITYSRVGGRRAEGMKGASGVAMPTFQFDAWAADSPAAREVAELINKALVGFSGVMGGAGGVNVQGTHFENEQDDYFDDLEAFVVSTDISIHHDDPTAT